MRNTSGGIVHHSHHQNHRDLEQVWQDIESNFVDVSSRCPYGFDQKAVYHQAAFGWLDDYAVGRFLEKGYRRNGNSMYTMRCPDCSLCVPIRIRPEAFQPNRNQKRVMKKNRDVVAGVAPLSMSKENLDVLEKYLMTRFPSGTSCAARYYTGFFITSIARCFEIRYRVEEKLMGVAIVDGSIRGLNAVYFYFDPDACWRSPGTFNIQYLVNFCLHHKIEYLYLGYWIAGLSEMDYKKQFRAHEILKNGRWEEIPSRRDGGTKQASGNK